MLTVQTEETKPLFRIIFSPTKMSWDDDDDDDDDDLEGCSPYYCIPDAYNVCGPDCDDDGACDPFYDDQF